MRNQIEKDLESDDELPNECNDIADIPAYKNDRRFDTIQFPWVKKFLSKGKQEQTYVWKSVLYSTINEQTVSEKTEHLSNDEKLLVTQGVLSQADILCIKCIENTTSDSVILWLINFLMYKDLQSNFGFLKTCLVEQSVDKHDIPSDCSFKSHNFEIVIEAEENC